MGEQVGRDTLPASPKHTVFAFLVVSLAIKLGIDLDGILPKIPEHGATFEKLAVWFHCVFPIKSALPRLVCKNQHQPDYMIRWQP